MKRELKVPSPLCEYCSKIPFDRDLQLLKGLDRADRTWALGKFEQVRRRDCPFCELVTSTCSRILMSWQPTQLPDDSEDVVVSLRGDRYFNANLSPLGSDIYPVWEGDWDSPDLDRARASFDEWIDLEGVRQWITHCEKVHGHICSPARYATTLSAKQSDHQAIFRVIDVNKLCIVAAETTWRYVALSYVWDSLDRPRLVLTRDNESLLRRPGELSKARSSIPHSILDAISVVRGLKERYLWVDSLCLVQDDADEIDRSVAIVDTH